MRSALSPRATVRQPEALSHRHMMRLRIGYQSVIHISLLLFFLRCRGEKKFQHR